MSDFCRGCAYDEAKKSGPNACPFNYLYWAFLMRNRSRLQGNPRLDLPYRNLNSWTEERKSVRIDEADAFLTSSVA